MFKFVVVVKKFVWLLRLVKRVLERLNADIDVGDENKSQKG